MTISTGIHHITAIASDPQRNYDFYTKILGLRFIKKTVNFDDPSTYHFYFANEKGDPGTVLTFFPHPDAAPGRQGTGKAVEITFAVPQNALGFWVQRLIANNVACEGPEERFGDKVIRFKDPDGLILELIATDAVDQTGVHITDEIRAEHAIRGFHSTTLWTSDLKQTAAVLTTHFGFQKSAEDGTRHRYSTGQSGIGQIVDVLDLKGFARGELGAGVIHHIAFRAADDAHLMATREAISGAGFHITPMIDRDYFHSLYFREPNGIVFEVATDGPGFTIDEPLDKLGETLRLPKRYESNRAHIEDRLVSIT